MSFERSARGNRSNVRSVALENSLIVWRWSDSNFLKLCFVKTAVLTKVWRVGVFFYFSGFNGGWRTNGHWCWCCYRRRRSHCRERYVGHFCLFETETKLALSQNPPKLWNPSNNNMPQLQKANNACNSFARSKRVGTIGFGDRCQLETRWEFRAFCSTNGKLIEWWPKGDHLIIFFLVRFFLIECQVASLRLDLDCECHSTKSKHREKIELTLALVTSKHWLTSL